MLNFRLTKHIVTNSKITLSVALASILNNSPESFVSDLSRKNGLELYPLELFILGYCCCYCSCLSEKTLGILKVPKI